MKELRLLIWLTQLGLSAAMPLAGFLLPGIWLHRNWGWGQWSVWAGLGLGFYFAVKGFRDSLKVMEQMAAQPQDAHDHSCTSEEPYGE